MMNKFKSNRRSRFSGQFSESRLNAILGAAMRGTVAACLLTGAAVIVGAGFHTGAWLAEKAVASAATERMLLEASNEYERQMERQADCIAAIAEAASQHGTSLDATCQQAKAAMKYWADREASMEASMEASEAGSW